MSSLLGDRLSAVAGRFATRASSPLPVVDGGAQRRLRSRRALSIAMLALGLCLAAPAVRAAGPAQVLIVEPRGPDIWRAEARGVWIEFQRDVAREGRLLIRFVNPTGEPAAPPRARRITLTGPDGKVLALEVDDAGWRSAPAFGRLADGSVLSIVEDDHSHDFKLNVHEAAAAPVQR